VFPADFVVWMTFVDVFIITDYLVTEPTKVIEISNITREWRKAGEEACFEAR